MEKYQQIFNLQSKSWAYILRHYLNVGPNDDIDKLFYNNLNMVWGITIFEPFKKIFLSFGVLRFLHYMQKIILFARGNLIENVNQFYEINKKLKYLIAPLYKVANSLKPLLAVIYFESEIANAIKPRICILGYFESQTIDFQAINKITKNFNFSKFYYQLSIFHMIYIERNEKVLPLKNLIQRPVTALCRCFYIEIADDVLDNFILLRVGRIINKKNICECFPVKEKNLTLQLLRFDTEPVYTNFKKNLTKFTFDADHNFMGSDPKYIKIIFTDLVSLSNHFLVFSYYSLETDENLIQDRLFKALSRKKDFKPEGKAEKAIMHQANCKLNETGSLTLDKVYRVFLIFSFFTDFRTKKKQFSSYPRLIEFIENLGNSLVLQFKSRDTFDLAFKGLAKLLLFNELKEKEFAILCNVSELQITELMIETIFEVLEDNSKHLNDGQIESFISLILNLPCISQDKLIVKMAPLSNNLHSITVQLVENDKIITNPLTRGQILNIFLEKSSTSNESLLMFLNLINSGNRREKEVYNKDKICVFLKNHFSKTQNIEKFELKNIELIFKAVVSDEFYKGFRPVQFLGKIISNISFSDCYDLIGICNANPDEHFFSYIKLPDLYKPNCTQIEIQEVLRKADNELIKMNPDQQERLSKRLSIDFPKNKILELIDTIYNMKSHILKDIFDKEISLELERLHFAAV